MLNENIKALRCAKGLSQEELAVKLHVVRQTVSKWEQNRSVPDADMLIALSEALETPVSTLLGETVTAPRADDWKAIAEKLEVVNLQLAERRAAGRRVLHGLFLTLAAAVVAAAAALLWLGSPYLGWDLGDPETAVAGAALHAFEWLFVRSAPLILLGAIAGAVLTRRRD